jgi:pilus assembly protein Flp/PilA
MNSRVFKLFLELQNLKSRDEGQDLVEYGLIVLLISLAAVVGMQTLASALGSAFMNIGTGVKNVL